MLSIFKKFDREQLKTGLMSFKIFSPLTTSKKFQGNLYLIFGKSKENLYLIFGKSKGYLYLILNQKKSKENFN